MVLSGICDESAKRGLKHAARWIWPLTPCLAVLCRWSSAGRMALSTSSEDGSPTGRDLARLPESTGWVSSSGCVFFAVCVGWGCVTHAHECVCMHVYVLHCPTKSWLRAANRFGSPYVLCSVHGGRKHSDNQHATCGFQSWHPNLAPFMERILLRLHDSQLWDLISGLAMVVWGVTHSKLADLDQPVYWV